MKLKLFVIALLVQIFIVLPATAQTVHLSVAASMTNAFNKIINGFLATRDTRFRTNFASSGSLAKQIQQGAPCDIYVSANPKWMNFLIEKNKLHLARIKSLPIINWYLSVRKNTLV